MTKRKNNWKKEIGLDRAEGQLLMPINNSSQSMSLEVVLDARSLSLSFKLLSKEALKMF